MSDKELKFYQNYISSKIQKRKQAFKKLYTLKKCLGLPQVILNSVSIASISTSMGYDSVSLKVASLVVSSICLILSSIQNFFSIDNKLHNYKNELEKLNKIKNKLNQLQFKFDSDIMNQVLKDIDNVSSDDSEIVAIEISTPTIERSDSVLKVDAE